METDPALDNVDGAVDGAVDGTADGAVDDAVDDATVDSQDLLEAAVADDEDDLVSSVDPEAQEPAAPPPKIDAATMKPLIREILDTRQGLTVRQVREGLESKLGLDADGLLDKKAEIRAWIIEAEQQRQNEASRKRAKPTAGAAAGATASTNTTASASNEAEQDDAAGSEDESVSPVKKKKPATKNTKMSRRFFLDHAEEFTMEFHGVTVKLTPREFGTGSCGWFFGGKHEVPVGGKQVNCQFTFNATVLGSKQWS